MLYRILIIIYETESKYLLEIMILKIKTLVDDYADIFPHSTLDILPLISTKNDKILSKITRFAGSNTMSSNFVGLYFSTQLVDFIIIFI